MQPSDHEALSFVCKKQRFRASLHPPANMSEADFYFTPKPDSRPGRLEFDLQSELEGWEKGLFPCN